MIELLAGLAPKYFNIADNCTPQFVTGVYEDKPIACSRNLRVLSLKSTGSLPHYKMFEKNKFPALEEVHLTGECPGRTPNMCYPGLLAACPNIRVLTCHGCCGLLKNIENCRNLTSLTVNFSCCREERADVDELLALMKCRGPIKELNVYCGSKFIHGLLGLLFSPFSQVESLSLTCYSAFNDDQFFDKGDELLKVIFFKKLIH